LANNGPSSFNGNLYIDFYLSANTVFADGDDVKIGDINFDYSLLSSEMHTLFLTEYGLEQMVRLWPDGMICQDYYLFARVRINQGGNDPNASNDHTRRNIPFTLIGDACPEITTYPLRIDSSNPSSDLPVAVYPADIYQQGSGVTPMYLFYNAGTVVNLTAPAFNVHNDPFIEWIRNGEFYSDNPATQVTISEFTHMFAVYAYPSGSYYNLTVESENPSNGISVSVNRPDIYGRRDGITWFNRTYASSETSITLTAPATNAQGSPFVEWRKDDVFYDADLSTSVWILGAHVTMTAVYEPTTFDLTINSLNPDSGIPVTVTPLDNENQGDGTTSFTRTYDEGTNVTLTAPAANSDEDPFVEWRRNGAFYSSSPTVQVTMNADYTMTAVYELDTYDLTVNSLNPDSGISITVTPLDNENQGNGTTSFTRTYDEGTNVTLTAPAANSGQDPFLEWRRNGAFYSSNRTVQVTMNADHTMTAVYQTPFELILTDLEPTEVPDQPNHIGVELTAPSPVNLAGILELEFVPNQNAEGLPEEYDNPLLQFAGGGKTLEFTISQGSTVAVLDNDGEIQQGTVAGTIIARLTRLMAGLTDLLPQPPPSRSVEVPLMVPVIESVEIINSSGGFNIRLTGYSTPRALISARFQFHAASGTSLSGGSQQVDIADISAVYFESGDGRYFGSTFELTQPFTFSGDRSALGSVTVTLTNSVGTSASVSGAF
jgi:hypothetical protein